jgi:hypothetical protein
VSRANTDRGKETERIAVKGLRGLGFPNAERVVRTGYRVTDRELPDQGDIDGTPGLAWQVKSLRPATRAEAAVPGWMVETEQQRVAAGATVGVLIVRRDGCLPARWWAFLPAVDLYGLADGFTGNSTPAPLRHVDQGGDVEDRVRIPLMPVRFELADLCLLLRSAGFGEPLNESEGAA